MQVRWETQNLPTSQVAHQARAYPGLCSMKRPEVLLLHPGWDAGPSQDYPPPPPHWIRQTYLYTLVERGILKIEVLAQNHNPMSSAS